MGAAFIKPQSSCKKEPIEVKGKTKLKKVFALELQTLLRGGEVRWQGTKLMDRDNFGRTLKRTTKCTKTGKKNRLRHFPAVKCFFRLLFYSNHFFCHRFVNDETKHIQAKICLIQYLWNSTSQTQNKQLFLSNFMSLKAQQLVFDCQKITTTKKAENTNVCVIGCKLISERCFRINHIFTICIDILSSFWFNIGAEETRKHVCMYKYSYLALYHVCIDTTLYYYYLFGQNVT